MMLDSNEMFMPHVPCCGYKIIEAHDTYREGMEKNLKYFQAHAHFHNLC